MREQLIHSNITFATEIADIQEGITKNLTSVVDYISELIGFQIKPSEYIEVSLIPPTVLMLQLIEMTSGSASNITATFQNLQLPFDPYYFLQKYVPHIDWDEFKKSAQVADAEKTITDPMGQPDAGGGY